MDVASVPEQLYGSMSQVYPAKLVTEYVYRNNIVSWRPVYTSE